MGFLDFFRRPRRESADILSDGEPYWYGPMSTFPPADATHAGEQVTATNLLTSATCFACSKVLGETIAGLPAMVYRRNALRKDSDPTSEAIELLGEQPNPEMDAFTFWELATYRVINAGNFFAEIQRDNRDRPIGLWPIHPSRVRPLRDPVDHSLYWEVAADFVGTPAVNDPTWRKEHLTYLSPHQMLNIVGFGSTNGVISPGVLPAGQEVAMDFATRRYGGAYFKDGTTPAGYVQHPKFIDSPAKREMFRQDINNIHNSKRHQVGVLWEGATYQKIAIDPEQAQFLETRKFTADQLCKFYGVPPAIIGDYEHSKFATADAMIRHFVMFTLRNLAVRMEKAINRQVLNVRGEDGRLQRAFTKNLIYQIAIDGLLRGDPKTQADAWQTYRTLGVATTNEIRQDIGLNPIEGPQGDYLIVNGGMARLDQIDNQGSRAQVETATPAPAPEAKLPEFDRDKLISLLETQIERPTQVRGHEPIQSAAVRVAESALERINKITATQVERWREQDPAIVAQKLPEFIEKQRSRLEEALAPLADLADPDLPKAIADEYHKAMAALDNHTIFGKLPTLPIKELVNAAFS